MYSGPAKSTPVVENGGASLTRKSGNGGGTGEPYGLPSNLRHTAHRCMMPLTRLLPCTIQYLARGYPLLHCGRLFHVHLSQLIQQDGGAYL